MVYVSDYSAMLSYLAAHLISCHLSIHPETKQAIIDTRTKSSSYSMHPFATCFSLNIIL